VVIDHTQYDMTSILALIEEDESRPQGRPSSTS